MGYDVTEVGAVSLRDVVPSDTVNLPDGICRALWIGGAGTVAIVAEDDVTAVTISGVLAGTLLPIRTRRVNVTGTSATLITALY